MVDAGTSNAIVEWLCIFMCAVIFITHRLNENEKMNTDRYFDFAVINNMIMLIFDSIAYLVKGNMTPLGITAGFFTNYAVFILDFSFLYYSAKYMEAFMEIRRARNTDGFFPVKLLSIAGMAICAVGNIFGLFFYMDASNVYHRGSYFPVTNALWLLGIILLALCVFRYHASISDREKVMLGSYMLIPLFALLMSFLNYGFPWAHLGTTLTVVAVYVGVQAEQALVYQQRQMEYERSRTDLVLSQVKPHFLCNALIAVAEICTVDPDAARTAVLDFATYLRGNLDSTQIKDPIPFSRELEHVKKYLNLEKLRFQDELNAEYRIEYTDFMLPPLTIQPLVENAIRHGIRQKGEPGTVTIHSYRLIDRCVVTVEDDGVGFDQTELFKKKNLRSTASGEDRSHLGIRSVKARLADMCDGKLLVESERGRGTKVTVTIPLDS